MDDDEITERTENDAAIEAGERLGALAARIIHEGDSSLLILPDGYRCEDLTKAIRANFCAPLRIEASPKFTDVESFCLYLDRFATPATMLFGRQEHRVVGAAIDYHEPGAPSWATHEAHLLLSLSPEWQAWSQGSGKWMDQEAWGNWLQDHALDVAEPTAAALEEIISNLELRRDVAFRSVQNLQDGTRRFMFEETEHGNQGQLVVPTRFKLALRVYVGEEPCQVPARLRYRMQSGKLAFVYILDHPERIAEDAWVLACSQISKRTRRPVLQGTR